ncbi:YbaB/EbfC family nucleoid-associated protein [Nocardia puris]|uniref:YbaB/EbfC DNA-binding family protein n=1 Tax=Nocardia puris TaxID=208602 RepID=A0A366D852_9NOCA|nr:YbaB/EbfC family nucleoid-associated protein [Nocardia puris]MBF6212404.1 YbaB/EbfC family nucleoid-associated protein [Nocardia puris]MBF6366651.1 YbaB/EbfC family nucleoid-associated protein [Nocardia puris]MBF6460993.1 YbaB/EbfC family nucleoid-associated protein [Nocardia puris]RBO85644.1 YbaB/EbfC DNA-binding family protein [Nocardia puris]
MSAEMDALVANATQKLEALEAALFGLKQVRGRFTTEDESVTVEVNSEGALVGLTLAESVTSMAPAEVSQLIVWACRQASEDAGAQRSKVVATLNESFAPEAKTAPGGAG